MGIFHEVLPGILVFFHFYYIRTKELEYSDHTTELYVKVTIVNEVALMEANFCLNGSVSKLCPLTTSLELYNT